VHCDRFAQLKGESDVASTGSGASGGGGFVGSYGQYLLGDFEPEDLA